MSNRIVFNFFSDSKVTAINNLCSYFNIPLVQLKEALFDGCSVETFINDLKIDLTAYDSKKIVFVGRHVTTANDETIESFKEKGLLDLYTALQSNTPLSKFLQSFKIQINVDEKTIKINEKLVKIEKEKGDKHKCFKGRSDICSWLFGCEAFEKLSALYHKLYDMEATLEFFVAGSLEEMLDYSVVSKYPEILSTIDQLIWAIEKPSVDCTYPLSRRWMSGHADCYVIEFNTPLINMETFNPINYISAFQEIQECFRWSNITYDNYYNYNVPQRVFDNIYLIRRFIDVYVYHSVEQYGSLLPRFIIPSNELKIYKIIEGNFAEIKIYK